MAPEDLTAGMLDALDGASSFQLSQLKALINVMLLEPKRTVAASASLHLGQSVRFVDFRTGDLRHGKLIARKQTEATVLEAVVNRRWTLPYVSIEAAPAPMGDAARPYDPPPEPRPANPSALAVGDRVSFEAKGLAKIGIVTKINRRTVSVLTDDRQEWRVGFGLARHVLEV